MVKTDWKRQSKLYPSEITTFVRKNDENEYITIRREKDESKPTYFGLWFIAHFHHSVSHIWTYTRTKRDALKIAKSWMRSH